MTRENPPLGALAVTLAAASFAAMGALIKMVSADLGNPMVVFFRNLFGLVFLGPWLLRLRPRGLTTRRFGLHLLRVMAGLSAMYCFFWAIPRLHLSEAVLLNYSAPLFIPFVAYLWLGERVSRSVALAVVIGFVGIALILKPTPALFVPAGGVALLAGFLAAVAMTGIRRLSGTEPATRIVFYFTVLGTALSAPPLIWYWQTPSLLQLGQLAGIGAFASAGQLLMTRGYGLAPAAQVGPFIYTSVVFAGLYGWALWGERPDLFSAAGMLLVMVAGGLAMAYQQGRP